jgi:myo-inositol-1(or 4)-monophosphatase
MILERQLILLGKNICDKISKSVTVVSKKKALGKTLSKKSNNDYIKLADDLAEKVVKKILKNSANKKGIGKITLISEERGVQCFGYSEKNKDIIVILDPIDGSSNLRTTITPSPTVSVCVAIIPEKNSPTIKYAFVRDVFNKRLYYAIKNKGAYVDGFGRIKISKETKLKNAILGCDLDSTNKRPALIKKLSKLLKKAKAIRRLGSSALDFCKVACGEYDAFLSLTGRMGIYDIAAPKLIVEESGGIFEVDALKTDPDTLIKKLIKTKNKELINKNRFNVICSNSRVLHKKL